MPPKEGRKKRSKHKIPLPIKKEGVFYCKINKIATFAVTMFL
jgi:hypothetical protein